MSMHLEPIFQNPEHWHLLCTWNRLFKIQSIDCYYQLGIYWQFQNSR